MIPIYEQGGGRGIGHTADSFLERFGDICRQHVTDGRAKSFALVLYDFTDRDLRYILKDQGVFAQLDRLSGQELSVFYLHAGNRQLIQRFNETLIAELGLGDRVTLPSVVFFRLSEDGENFGDVALAQLDSADLVHGFHELYEVMQQYVDQSEGEQAEGSQALKWIASTSKFISIETVRAALYAAAGALF